jgi:uncharacterized membrane-anchored protein YjiN (DUF445 family)
MLPKSFTEWLTTAEGTSKALKALFLVLTALIVATHNVCAALGLPEWTVRVGAILITIAFAWTLLNSYRRFATASRLQRPDYFTLRPTDPASLFGRTSDLDKLLSAVQRNLLVILDGDSGCGKSALILSGLVPRLKSQPGDLLPVVVREWGDDWVRGPLASALQSLYNSLSATELESLDWLNPPDLAATAATLAPELESRLRAVFETLGRRPLLVADQFDDYQSLHRHRFLDADCSWITPKLLAESNLFWRLVRDALAESRMRLLVATRSDMASGSVCVRFVGDEYATVRSLPLVEGDYLRPLLAAIVPSDLTPPVVTNPDRGWKELCELLERDLKVEEAVLMQQVRTVLAGVRQLRVLTPRAYRAAGGVRGVEILAIASALRRASRSITIRSGRDHRERLDTARAVLGALVVAKGTRQRPKARQARFSVLNAIAGNQTEDTKSILHCLQEDEVVRPAAAVNGESSWQLDHDYLAAAVLSEARAANRWAVALDEGRERYSDAAGKWLRQWNALLPMTTLARLAWEYARRRLIIRGASRYLLASAIKPLLLLLCLALTLIAARIWDQDRRLTAEAIRVVDSFGGSQGDGAVMEIWHGSSALRTRVTDLIAADSSRLERAANTRWALAQVGSDPTQLTVMMALLRRIVEAEPETHSMGAVTTYTDLVQRVPQADVRSAFLTLQSQLRDRRYFVSMHELVRAYVALALRLSDEDIRLARLTLLDLVKDEEKAFPALYGYQMLASRLNATDARTENATLRQYISRENSSNLTADSAAYAYRAVSERLSNDDAQTEAVEFRHVIEHMPPTKNNHAAAEAYRALATRLTKDSAKAEAAALRELMKRSNPCLPVPEMVQAYIQIISHMEAPDIRTEGVELRTLFRDTASHVYVDAYAALVAKLNDADASSESEVLLKTLDEAHPQDAVPLLVAAYPVLAPRLPADQASRIATSLRARLDRESNSSSIGILIAYGSVAAEVSSSEARAAATLMAARWESARSSVRAREFALTYATIAAKLSDADVNNAVHTLHAMLFPELSKVEFRRDPVPLHQVIRVYNALMPRLTPAQARILLAALSGRVWSNTDPETIRSLTTLFDSLVNRLDSNQTRAHVSDLRVFMRNANLFQPDLSWQYASTIARLPDSELEAEATTLTSNLLEDMNRESVASLTRAYTAVARQLLRRKDEAIRPRLVQQALILAGHPFLENRVPLLDLLGELAGSSFNGDVTAAVSWASRSYGIEPAQLRPM